jgi:hypothetical protein
MRRLQGPRRVVRIVFVGPMRPFTERSVMQTWAGIEEAVDVLIVNAILLPHLAESFEMYLMMLRSRPERSSFTLTVPQFSELRHHLVTLVDPKHRPNWRHGKNAQWTLPSWKQFAQQHNAIYSEWFFQQGFKEDVENDNINKLLVTWANFLCCSEFEIGWK